MNPDRESEVMVSTAVAVPESGPAKLRLLVASDLAPGGEARGPIAVDRNGFARLLAELAPRLELRVPNRLGTGEREMVCSLTFTELDSFHPDRIAAVVPATADLLAARRVLAARLAGEIDAETLRQSLPVTFQSSDLGERLRAARATTPSGGAAGGNLDELLAAVDVPAAVAGAAVSAASLVEVLAGAMLPPSAPGGDVPAVEAVLAEVDVRLSRQIATICETPALRALEAAWRGLFFLLERTDPRGPFIVEVLPVGREDLLEEYYSRVFQPEYQTPGETPLALVFADFAFERSPEDLETLQHAARMGASLQTPFVAALAPQYFGVRQPALLASMPDPVAKCRSAEYAKWNRFRKDELSLWVTLAVNRFLLRDAWGGDGAPVASFAWRAAEASPLWGSAVWALAAAAVQAFAAEGFRLPLAGAQPPALLENLPVRPLKVGKADPVACPLEVMLTTQRAVELSECGFAPLVCAAGKDSASFLTAPTLHAATRYDEEAATRASFRAATLPYQAFAGAAAHALDALARDLPARCGEEGAKAHIRAGMIAFLAGCEPTPVAEEVEVELSAAADRPGSADVVVRLRPLCTVYGGEVDLVIGTAVTV